MDDRRGLAPRFWRFVHNVAAHPLMEVLPTRWGDWLHDRTAALAFIQQEPKR